MIATDGSYASELDRVGCVDDAGRCTRLDRPPLIDDYWGLPAAAIARRTLQVAGVCYLPADLNFEGVDELLGRSGFDARRPAFFSWLGVTAYLTREANLKTFGSIASCGAPRSELAFNAGCGLIQ